MSNKLNKIIDSTEPLKVYFWSLVFVLVFCLLSYGYLVSGAIVNVVERQNTEKAISALNSKVIELESDYYKTKNNITIEMATDLGFVSASNHKFVTKDVKNPGLSLLTPGL
jgi:hypothetical protein